MEAAPSANPRRAPPPIPPNYVSLRQLQELRLKEKEEQEKRRREAEAAAAAAAARREAENAAATRREAEKEAAARRKAEKEAAARRKAEKEGAARRDAEKAAAARRDAEKAAAVKREAEKAAASKREAEKAAAAATAKREAALKAETKGRGVSLEASGGAKERRRGGPQWVAVSHPAPTSRPMAPGDGAAGEREAAIGGGRGEKGPDGAPDNGPNGGGKPLVKGKEKGKRKGKGKLAEPAPAPSHGGKLAEVVPASSPGGKPENKSEPKAKGKVPGGQAAESSSSGGGPAVAAEAAILSSRDGFRRRRPAGAGSRSAETCPGIAPVKTAGPSPPRGVRSDDTGEPRPPAPRRVDAVAGNGSPDGKRAAPGQAPPISAADGSSKPTSGGELRKTMEAKPEGPRRRQVVEVQAVAELKSRVSRFSAGPWRGGGNDAVEQHGRVWVPKAAAVAGGGRIICRRRALKLPE